MKKKSSGLFDSLDTDTYDDAGRSQQTSGIFGTENKTEETYTQKINENMTEIEVAEKDKK